MIKKITDFIGMLIKEDRYVTLVIIVALSIWLTFKIWTYIEPITELIGQMFAKQSDQEYKIEYLEKQFKTLKENEKCVIDKLPSNELIIFDRG